SSGHPADQRRCGESGGGAFHYRLAGNRRDDAFCWPSDTCRIQLARQSTARPHMPQKTWELTGQYMESCDCDYLCPCIFTNSHGPAPQEHCPAFMVYRIARGHRGDVSLDGLKFALVIRSQRVMADGGGVFGVVVDEKANAAQRQALGDIVSGKAGGPPQM